MARFCAPPKDGLVVPRYAVLLILLAAIGIGLEVAQVRLVGTGINDIKALATGLGEHSHAQSGFLRDLLHPAGEFWYAIRRVALMILLLAGLNGINSLVTRIQSGPFPRTDRTASSPAGVLRPAEDVVQVLR